MRIIHYLSVAYTLMFNNNMADDNIIPIGFYTFEMKRLVRIIINTHTHTYRLKGINISKRNNGRIDRKTWTAKKNEMIKIVNQISFFVRREKEKLQKVFVA